MNIDALGQREVVWLLQFLLTFSSIDCAVRARRSNCGQLGGVRSRISIWHYRSEFRRRFVVKKPVKGGFCVELRNLLQSYKNPLEIPHEFSRKTTWPSCTMSKAEMTPTTSPLSPREASRTSTRLKTFCLENTYGLTWCYYKYIINLN